MRGVVLNMHDVDNRKRAEEGVERERARLEQAQRVAGVGSFEQDPTTTMVYPSAELCRVLGIPVVSHFAVETLIDAVHPDDRLAVGTAMRANIETGTPVGPRTSADVAGRDSSLGPRPGAGAYDR